MGSLPIYGKTSHVCGTSPLWEHFHTWEDFPITRSLPIHGRSSHEDDADEDDEDDQDDEDDDEDDEEDEGEDDDTDTTMGRTYQTDLK